MVITRAKKKAAEPLSRITRAKKKPAEAATPNASPNKKTSSTIARSKDTEQRAEAFIDQAQPAALPAIASPAESVATTADASISVRERQALALVKDYLPWAGGAALVPIPGVDLAAIVAVQLTMLSKLSAHYGIAFKKSAAKSSAASLMALVLQGALAGGLASAGKMVPVVGALVGIAALPAFAAAGTYAIGKVFITHFEAGGTFLDFEPKKVEQHFRAEFEQARRSG